jgi:hypothetical protein
MNPPSRRSFLKCLAAAPLIAATPPMPTAAQTLHLVRQTVVTDVHVAADGKLAYFTKDVYVPS